MPMSEKIGPKNNHLSPQLKISSADFRIMYNSSMLGGLTKDITADGANADAALLTYFSSGIDTQNAGKYVSLDYTYTKKDGKLEIWGINRNEEKQAIDIDSI
ncbi:MAG: hypothetical protein KAJ14_10625, partial [Candidatus Omnitrophica bacterium]|nr:hypothetical protein [Candidatus Omnitrophota bacterium]